MRGVGMVLDALAAQAGAALVQAIVTDGWEGVRHEVARWFGRGEPDLAYEAFSSLHAPIHLSVPVSSICCSSMRLKSPGTPNAWSTPASRSRRRRNSPTVIVRLWRPVLTGARSAIIVIWTPRGQVPPFSRERLPC